VHLEIICHSHNLAELLGLEVGTIEGSVLKVFQDQANGRK